MKGLSVILLSFVAKTLEQVVFTRYLLSFHRTTSWTLTNQDLNAAPHPRLLLLSDNEALRIVRADSKSSVVILLDLSTAFNTVNH